MHIECYLIHIIFISMPRKRLFKEGNAKRVSFLIDPDLWERFETLCLIDESMYPSEVLRRYVKAFVEFKEQEQEQERKQLKEQEYKQKEQPKRSKVKEFLEKEKARKKSKKSKDFNIF